MGSPNLGVSTAYVCGARDGVRRWAGVHGVGGFVFTSSNGARLSSLVGDGYSCPDPQPPEVSVFVELLHVDGHRPLHQGAGVLVLVVRVADPEVLPPPLADTGLYLPSNEM